MSTPTGIAGLHFFISSRGQDGRVLAHVHDDLYLVRLGAPDEEVGVLMLVSVHDMMGWLFSMQPRSYEDESPVRRRPRRRSPGAAAEVQT